MIAYWRYVAFGFRQSINVPGTRHLAGLSIIDPSPWATLQRIEIRTAGYTMMGLTRSDCEDLAEMMPGQFRLKVTDDRWCVMMPLQASVTDFQVEIDRMESVADPGAVGLMVFGGFGE